jgi:S-methylmethionine-dependent homocysteine/selenocysteine methylase
MERSRVLILDGPTGTELIARGYKADPALWTARAALDSPVLLRGIHDDYLRAGANIITANTFRASTRAAAKAGLQPADARKMIHASLASATEAIEAFDGKGLPLFVAASVGPLEDCYRPELTPSVDALELEHAEKARWIAETGCDLVCVETMPTAREAVVATRSARRAGNEGVITSFITDETGARLLGGDPLLESARACAAEGASVLLVNCVDLDAAERALGVLTVLREDGLGIGAYANASRMKVGDGGKPSWEADPRPLEERAREYGARAARWARLYGAVIIGSCCGTGPEYIRQLNEAL